MLLGLVLDAAVHAQELVDVVDVDGVPAALGVCGVAGPPLADRGSPPPLLNSRSPNSTVLTLASTCAASTPAPDSAMRCIMAAACVTPSPAPPTLSGMATPRKPASATAFTRPW
jgi:hypothetical protein